MLCTEPLLQASQVPWQHMSRTVAVTHSFTQDETFYPSRMYITSCQVATTALNSTLGRSIIEMLINSNQYQVLCLKWAAGRKTAAAELRLFSKHLGYKGKSTGPKISFTFKRTLAGVTLRSSGTAGPNLTSWQREWVLVSSALHTIIFIKQDPMSSFPTCALPVLLEPSALAPGKHLLWQPIPNPWKTDHVVHRWIWTPENTNGCFISRGEKTGWEERFTIQWRKCGMAQNWMTETQSQ